jgi:hypothetical protein
MKGEITYKGMVIEYDYSYDPGVHTFSNGDPGYPPSEELVIESITRDGKEVELSFEEIDKIEIKCIKHAIGQESDRDEDYPGDF